MKVDVTDLLVSAGMESESFYPGKKLVKKFIPHGEHKSHCMVFTWHDNIVRAELKAGVYGYTLDAKELRQYPISFQAPTYVEILTGNNDNTSEEDDEDGETSASGKSGGGGKKPSKAKESDIDMSKSSIMDFSKMADGDVSTLGEIQKFVVMGKELAKEAYAQAFENLKVQLSQAKVMAMDLMKDVSNIIKKATPGGGLKPHGDETIKYKYDSERTAGMFGGLTPS